MQSQATVCNQLQTPQRMPDHFFAGVLIVFASRSKSLFAVAPFALLAATGSSFAGTGKVYVADEGANTVSVSVIDAASLGFTPDGRFGFVSLSAENKVAVIDPVGRKVMRKIAVGTVPIQLHATPDSRLLLVANQGTPKNPGTRVSVIDVACMQVVATIKTGAGAHGVVVGRWGGPVEGPGRTA